MLLQKKLAFFQKLKNKYGNIEIIDELMDNRLMVYESQLENPFGCRRPSIGVAHRFAWRYSFVLR